MDMISLGPTTENAHSPSERLHVPSLSLSHLWDFLVALLQSLSQARSRIGGRTLDPFPFSRRPRWLHRMRVRAHGGRS